MTLDFSNMSPLEEEYIGSKVFVDDIQIELAFYIDTENGLVRTYDVMKDGKPHWWGEQQWNEGVYGSSQSAAWIELQGRVRIEKKAA